MNQRIKELMSKSQRVVGHTDGGYTEIQALDSEKFAELIVKECIDWSIDNKYIEQEYDAANFTKELKQHFGVKE